MIFTSRTFWALVAGLIAFAIKFFMPAFPFTADQILAGIVFLLGLVNVVPQLRIARLTARGITASDILKSKPFWVMVVGFLGFVVRYYLPAFPLDDATILVLTIFILGLFNVYPELRARASLAFLLKRKAEKAKPLNVKGAQPK